MGIGGQDAGLDSDQEGQKERPDCLECRIAVGSLWGHSGGGGLAKLRFQLGTWVEGKCLIACEWERLQCGGDSSVHD